MNVVAKGKHAESFGINVDNVTFDYGKMKARKDDVVTKIRGSLGGLLKSNGIKIFQGTAQFESPKELKVKGADNALIQDVKNSRGRRGR